MPCLFLILQGCSDNSSDAASDEVPCNIDENFTFKNDENKGIDYVIDCETYITADVIVEAGTVLEFTSSGSIIIADGGSIKAIGTADEIIVMRGRTDGQGTWRGIHFESNSLKNKIDYCLIKNAGNEKWPGYDEPSAVAVSGRVSIINSEINYNRGVGVILDKYAEEDALVEFSNNEISDNTSFPVSVNIININSLKGENLYIKNDIEKIRVKANQYEGMDLTFHENSIPYYIEAGSLYDVIYVSNEVYAPASLTIEAGNTLLFDENTGIDVAGKSTLKILGQPGSRVKLKGNEDLPNYWKGIYHKGLSQSNIIQNTEISGGASSSFDGASTRTSLRLGKVGTCCESAYMKLNNVSFENARCAISRYGDETILEMTDVEYSNVENINCD